MRIWISCLMILLVMLATLSITPNLNLPYIHGFILVVFGMFIVLLFLSEYLIHKLLIIQTPYPSIKDLSKKTLSKTPKLLYLLHLVIVIFLVFFAGLHTMHSVQSELTNEITQPMRVLATVHPVGLSDSNINVTSQAKQNRFNNTKLINTSYRQLAIIESAQPLNLDYLTNNTQISTRLESLSGKQILLSAHHPSLIKNSKLPKGFSKDFSGLNNLQPNQHTQMILELKPLPTFEKGFIHRWLRSRHVAAQAKIIAYDKKFVEISQNDWQTRLNQWRWEVRKHFLSDSWDSLSINQQQAKAVTLSLFTGDQALINTHTKDLYQLAGISHLLAISGTHVLFCAIFLSTLLLFCTNRFSPQLYNYVPKSQLRWLVMVSGALLYALFTGFDVPSARTVYMLMAVGFSRLLLLHISSRQVLLIVAVLMAFHDPYVLWQAGFWLSFVAVMLLISYDISVNQTVNHEETFIFSKTNRRELGKSTIISLQSIQFMQFAKLQLWIFLALLPFSLLLFGKVSLWGVLVNLFAIGLYGWVIVPLNLLAGLIYPFSSTIADLLWHLVNFLLEITHSSLSLLLGASASSQSWLYTNINAGMLLIIALIALPLILPNKATRKLWSLPPLVLLGILIVNQSSSTLINRTDTSQPKLTLLSTNLGGANRYISSQLLTQGEDNWFIIANHQPLKTGKNKVHNQIQTADSTELTKQWRELLGKSGVSALTGVIIQTPSPELLEASKSLKNNIPIGFIWLAGKNQLSKLKSETKTSIPDYVLSCKMGQTWTNLNNSLTIKAITGWEDINDQGVWACALHIDSLSRPIQLNNQYPVHWINYSDRKIDSNPKIADTANYKLTDKSLQSITSTQQVILNAGDKSSKSWQLWSLLCLPDDKLLKAKNVSKILLTHSTNDLPDELLQMDTNIQTLALLDEPTHYNQQKLPRTLIDWQNKNQHHHKAK